MKRIHSLSILSILALQTLSPMICKAQENIISKWEDRVRATSAKQPGWSVPVFSPSATIVQLFRTDFVHQYTAARTETMNFDNSKGFNLIPFYNVELDVDLPPFIQHNNPKVVDGTGDFSAALKYRVLTGNEKHGDYSLAAQVLATGATGSYKNGTASTTFTPTVIGGKGFGKFDIQSSIGALMPTHSVGTIGRTIAWNTTAQYKLGKYFWPELESNASYYHLGPNNGKNQVFLTPGLMVHKIKFRHDPKDRLAWSFGAGMQIATSTYHAYNHSMVFSSRLAF